MTLKKKYDELKKKYTLPEFSKLNLNFEIEDIDSSTELLLQKIRIKIEDKIESYANIIESIVQPETSLKDMYQAKYIEDSSRESAYLLFKDLMHVIRYSNLVSVNNTEEENAIFIKESFRLFELNRDKIFKQIEELLGVWKKDTDMKKDFGYFG